MSRAALARLVAGCVAVAPLVALPSPHESPFVASVVAQARERVLYVSAYDGATYQPITNLGIDAFVVREDGTRREVLRVTPATSSMPVAVLVDNSQAVAPAISDLRRALTAFFNTIDGLGPVAVITMADRPTVMTDYTSSRQTLVDSANRLFHAPSSGATLLDAMSEVARGLAKREEDRAAMVVIATENIDYSHLLYQEVLEHLRTGGVSVNVVLLVNPKSSLTTDEARNRAIVLDRGPRENGGVRIDVLTSMSFESRLQDLAAILKAQYRVVYARPESLIPPERIEVFSAKAGVDMRGVPARGQAK